MAHLAPHVHELEDGVVEHAVVHLQLPVAVALPVLLGGLHVRLAFEVLDEGQLGGGEKRNRVVGARHVSGDSQVLNFPGEKVGAWQNGVDSYMPVHMLLCVHDVARGGR